MVPSLAFLHQNGKMIITRIIYKDRMEGGLQLMLFQKGKGTLFSLTRSGAD